MTIEKKINAENVTLALTGRLDTQTAPALEAELNTVLPACKNLIIDMAALEYISSAGLRVLLKTQKVMNAKGTMKVTHVNECIMEVFEITGFTDILTIE